ncbi:hypothetical protein U2I54_16170 [Bacillus pseudomycoides]|uniref:Uncharacterized protein n=1 Tax=Bacillus bingmayongensis TaxID=1150157 RepID=A0ABU5JZI9_9BACI|nr:hypothetical protein [Bacillus pseudomycoides]
MNMFGFANEETYNRIVKELGYTPENLKMNPHIPKGQIVMADMDALSELPRLLNREEYPKL